MTTCSLDQKSCIPCKGGVPPLELTEKERFLDELGEGWELTHDTTRLFKKYTFSNFKKAWSLAEKLAVIAEEQGHHPDMSLGWGYVGVEIQTHKINNLVESDFIFAAKAQKAYDELPKK